MLKIMLCEKIEFLKNILIKRPKKHIPSLEDYNIFKFLIKF